MDKVNIRQAARKVADMEPFVGSNVKGTERLLSFGKAPRSEWAWYSEHRDEIDYWVYSYETPVLLHHTTLGWLRTGAKYSPTTSRHLTQLTAVIGEVPAVPTLEMSV